MGYLFQKNLVHQKFCKNNQAIWLSSKELEPFFSAVCTVKILLFSIGCDEQITEHQIMLHYLS